MDKVVVVVDAYGVAQYFPQAIRARGYVPVHIQGQQVVPAVFQKRFDPNAYVDNIIFDGQNYDEVLQRLKKYNPVAIMPGIEPGVDLAEKLSHDFEFLTNDMSKGRVRRDKYWMIEELRKHGIAAARQFKSNNVSEIENWVHQENRWPVVIKPLDSAGCDGVAICHDMNAVKQACQRILGKNNILGLTNNEVLVQEFLKGDEYVVNSVSCQHANFICEIWRSHKRPTTTGGMLYDYEELLPFCGEVQNQLKHYHLSVLDALGICQGAAHAEIMLTDEGPKLVEIAARISGSTNPQPYAQSLGYNQIDLLLDAYLDPEKFSGYTQNEPKLKQGMLMAFMQSQNEGKIKAYNKLDELKSLGSINLLNIKLQLGDLLTPTCDLNSSPGFAYLLNSNYEQLMADYEKFKTLSAELFVV